MKYYVVLLLRSLTIAIYVVVLFCGSNFRCIDWQIVYLRFYNSTAILDQQLQSYRHFSAATCKQSLSLQILDISAAYTLKMQCSLIQPYPFPASSFYMSSAYAKIAVLSLTPV
jgi:hypothetical protein